MAIVDKVEEIIQGALAARGYDIVRIRLTGTKRMVLEVMIERKDQAPVSIDDCVTCSRVISVLLDVEDPIKNAYTLQVSSPGIDRPLVKRQDYERFCGEMVTLSLYQALDGRKKLKGQLKAVEDKYICLQLKEVPKEGEDQLLIPFENIRSANLFVEF